MTKENAPPEAPDTDNAGHDPHRILNLANVLVALLTVLVTISAAVLTTFLALHLERAAGYRAQAAATSRVIDRALTAAYDIGYAREVDPAVAPAAFRDDIRELKLLTYLGDLRVEEARACLEILTNDVAILANGHMPLAPPRNAGDEALTPLELIIDQADQLRRNIIAWREDRVSSLAMFGIRGRRAYEDYFDDCRAAISSG